MWSYTLMFALLLWTSFWATIALHGWMFYAFGILVPTLGLILLTGFFLNVFVGIFIALVMNKVLIRGKWHK